MTLEERVAALERRVMELEGRRPARRAEPGEGLAREIVRRVAAHYGLEAREITGPGRRASLIWPRHLAIYLARMLTGMSLPELGRLFGGRDDSSIVYGVASVRERCEVEPKRSEEVAEWLRIFREEMGEGSSKSEVRSPKFEGSNQ
jgi:chromosomal replication initiation ATPase DnaA